MKNYFLNRFVNEYGYIEVSESEYTDNQKDMKTYIDDILSNVIIKIDCGWDGVRYKVMSYYGEYIEEFMVLYADEEEARWISITGNSKENNFNALIENL